MAAIPGFYTVCVYVFQGPYMKLATKGPGPENILFFFENTVFTVFAFLQQFSFGFRAVFVGFRQCGCDLFLFRYPKICPPRCVRAFAFFFFSK